MSHYGEVIQRLFRFIKCPGCGAFLIFPTTHQGKSIETPEALKLAETNYPFCTEKKNETP
jgi:hypothetical protein